MSIHQIITLLEFCLENTYFHLQGKYFEQVHAAATSSSISPLIAYLFMEGFEAKAIISATHPPRLWLRYMDDKFIIKQAEYSHQFLQHINSIDPHIQFTMENPKDDGSIPSLNTLVSPGPNTTLITSIYRKSNHTDQYLDSDHNQKLTAEYTIYNTLAHGARVVCTSQ